MPEQGQMECGLLISSFNPVSVGQVLINEIQVSNLLRGLVSETLLFDSCLAPNVLKKTRSSGFLSIYLASFVLRHAVSWIVFCSEANKGRRSSAVFPYLENSPFGILFAEIHKFTKENIGVFSGIQFSLSARGIEWQSFAPDKCRFFDPYANSLDYCVNLPITNFCYCEWHSHFAWPQTAQWHKSPNVDLEKRYSTCSKLESDILLRHYRMLDFYADFNNVNAFSSADLEKMVEDFWGSFAKVPKFSEEMLHFANVMGYASLGELGQVSREDLRRKYRALAFELHPDRGGSLEDFLALQSSFAKLLNYLNK